MQETLPEFRFLILCCVLLSLFANHADARTLSGSISTNEPEEVYLSFRYASAVDGHLWALYHEGEIYVPVVGLFDLLQVDVDFDPSERRLRGYFLHEKNSYDLDFARGRGVVQDRTMQIEPSDFLIEESEVFVRPDLLERLFDLRLDFDMSRLSLRVESENPLPVAKAQERRRKLTNLYDPNLRYRQAPLLHARKRKWLGGGQMDYRLATSVSDGGLTQSLAIRTGIEVLGGDLRWDAGGSLAPLRFSSNDIQWRFVLDPNPWLTRVEIGTLGSSGLRAMRYNGVSITNEPAATRSLLVSEYDVTGATQPNWEVELYLNGRLVDYGRADHSGRYQFTIPLRYGTSDVRLVHYGPGGEVHPERRRLEIPHTFLPPGETSYTIHAGHTAVGSPTSSRRRPLVQGYGGIGLTSSVTARLGVDYVADTLRYAPVVYGALSSRLGSHVLMSLRAASSSQVDVSLNGHFPSRAALQLSYGRRSDKRMGGVLNAWTEQLRASGYVPFGPLSTRLSLTRERFSSWSRYDVHAQVAARRAHLQLRTDVRATAQERDGTLGARDVLVSPSIVASLGALKKWFGRASVRAHLDFDASDWTAAGTGIQLFTRVLDDGNLRLNISRNHRSRRTVVGLQLTYDLPSARTTTSVQHHTDQTVFVQSTSGSIGFDDGVVLGNRESVGRSAASVRMFVDGNGNGRRDADEIWVKGATVRVEETSTIERADSVTVHVLNLRPYARYNLNVVESSIRNPLWVPRHARFSFVAEPNAFKSIVIPLYAAGAVEGKVHRKEGDRLLPVSGARVHLVRTDGSVQETVMTFADGSFYSITLPPGDYEARLDTTQLATVGLSGGRTINFTVDQTAAGDFIDGLAFEIEGRASASETFAGALKESEGYNDGVQSPVDAYYADGDGIDGHGARRQGIPPSAARANTGAIGADEVFELYTVQPADIGLMDIARKVYGDGYLWPGIYWANRDVLFDPDRIEPGQQLRIPRPDEAAQREIWTYYRVRGSDIGLMDISRKLYRDGFLWPKIWLENRARLHDPHLVRPGIVLRIPPKAPLSPDERKVLFEFGR